MLVITYLGKTYIFTRKDTTTELETDTMFRERCWWIVKNIVKDSMDKKTIIALSHIWVSIKYYGAIYDDKTTDKLKTCEDVYIK
jgi:hypothetical protein